MIIQGDHMTSDPYVDILNEEGYLVSLPSSITMYVMSYSIPSPILQWRLQVLILASWP